MNLIQKILRRQIIEVENAIEDVAIELIELQGAKSELERAFPYLVGTHYYNRKIQIETRIDELTAILKKAETKEIIDAPEQQFILTKRR